MKKFMLGFCLGTIGIAVMSSCSDIIVNYAELVKARIGVKISECNKQINDLAVPHVETRAIGFATTNEEEEDYDE